MNKTNRVNEKPPPRMCPRCDSNNTKFCYYNNHCMSQPRYFCKNCRRYWTHGGTLRDIPIGGSSRKSKRPKKVQETNKVGGSSGESSSSVGNHFGSSLEVHPDMINVLPIRTFPPIEASYVSDESFLPNYYNFGSNDLVGHPLINQSSGGSGGVNSDPNSNRINQENLNN
ncbi:unnamed protein product [Thlaspi arvense]|uniref:Dof zinc finger protein n=1 Tax=Thlaspi arvense TaxID=13288 RepID=A0AAU9T6Y9_THLAR|nr:unnamed protein product [Thlaspi arvense]